LNQFKNNLCTPSYTEISHGKKILEREVEIQSYLALYAVHHTAKLDNAIANLAKNYSPGSKLEIIDWGCGQALASLVLLENLKNNQINAEQIESIHLIEPSKVSISKAKLLLNQYFNCDLDIAMRIKTINKDFDALTKSDLVLDEEAIKIHLFSNVLDLYNFDIFKLCGLITNSLKGVNLFLCVGPNYSLNALNTSIFLGEIQKCHKVNLISSKISEIPADYYRVVSGRFVTGFVKSSENIFIINN